MITLGTLQKQLDGHEELDRTRFEHVKNGLEDLGKRSGRIELAAWTTLAAVAAWALAHTFGPVVAPPAYATGYVAGHALVASMEHSK